MMNSNLVGSVHTLPGLLELLLCRGAIILPMDMTTLANGDKFVFHGYWHTPLSSFKFLLCQELIIQTGCLSECLGIIHEYILVSHTK